MRRRRGTYFDLAVALVGFALFFQGMHYPWQLAMPLGLALGALSFSTRRTIASLRSLSAGEPEDGGEDR